MNHKFLFIILLVVSISTRAQEFSHVFVFLNSNPEKEEISDEEAEALQAKHMESIDQLVKEDKLIVAGPFNGGGGIFILKTNDTNQAKQWLENDPAIRANRWIVEIFAVSIAKGGVCLASPPYDMITYNFARIEHINDIANYKMNTSSDELWIKLADQDSVLFAGRFPGSDGGVIVYQGNKPAILSEGITQDQFKHVTKELWVAKGSFCERP